MYLAAGIGLAVGLWYGWKKQSAMSEYTELYGRPATSDGGHDYFPPNKTLPPSVHGRFVSPQTYNWILALLVFVFFLIPVAYITATAPDAVRERPAAVAAPMPAAASSDEHPDL